MAFSWSSQFLTAPSQSPSLSSPHLPACFSVRHLRTALNLLSPHTHSPHNFILPSGHMLRMLKSYLESKLLFWAPDSYLPQPPGQLHLKTSQADFTWPTQNPRVSLTSSFPEHPAVSYSHLFFHFLAPCVFLPHCTQHKLYYFINVYVYFLNYFPIWVRSEDRVVSGYTEPTGPGVLPNHIVATCYLLNKSIQLFPQLH